MLLRQNPQGSDREPEFLEPDREDGAEGLYRLLDQFVKMLEGVDIDPGLFHGHLDPRGRVRVAGLGLTAFRAMKVITCRRFSSIICLRCSAVRWISPFSMILRAMVGKIGSVEDLHEGFIGCPGCL